MPASEDSASSDPSRATTRKRYWPGGRLSYDVALRPVATIQCGSTPSSLYRKTTRSGARRLQAVNSISTRRLPGPISTHRWRTLAIHRTDSRGPGRGAGVGVRLSKPRLDAGKPQFSIGRETSGGLNSAIDLWIPNRRRFRRRAPRWFTAVAMAFRSAMDAAESPRDRSSRGRPYVPNNWKMELLNRPSRVVILASFRFAREPPAPRVAIQSVSGTVDRSPRCARAARGEGGIGDGCRCETGWARDPCPPACLHCGLRRWLNPAVGQALIEVEVESALSQRLSPLES